MVRDSNLAACDTVSLETAYLPFVALLLFASCGIVDATLHLQQYNVVTKPGNYSHTQFTQQ